MKKIITLFIGLLFNATVGAILGAAAGIDPVASAIGMNGIAFIASFIPSQAGVLKVGILRELWTGELVKKLQRGIEGGWLNAIPDVSSAVSQDVIHLVDVGADPDVLINNTTYPIAIQSLTDGDIAISLDKFQTKVTSITDDELHAISYDKMARVIDSHSSSLNAAEYKKAAHAMCSDSNSATTPVLKTTGDVDSDTGRKTFTKTDILRVKKAMDKLSVPAAGRILVLCSDHINDILGWSETFQRQYNLDNVNGVVGRLFGFDIYEADDTPFYTTAGAKKALDSIPAMIAIAKQGNGGF